LTTILAPGSLQTGPLGRLACCMSIPSNTRGCRPLPDSSVLPNKLV